MTPLFDPSAQVATPSRSVATLNAAKWSKVVQKRACNKCDNYNRTNILAFGVPPIKVFCLSQIFSSAYRRFLLVYKKWLTGISNFEAKQNYKMLIADF
jgi:hypothetical protein